MLDIEYREADGIQYPSHWIRHQFEQGLVTESWVQKLVIKGYLRRSE